MSERDDERGHLCLVPDLSGKISCFSWLNMMLACGMRFVTLYRRQGSRPSPWKRNAKKQRKKGKI